MRKYLDIIAVNMAVVGLFALMGLGNVFIAVLALEGVSGFGPAIRSDAMRGFLLVAGTVYIAAVALLSAWDIITDNARRN